MDSPVNDLFNGAAYCQGNACHGSELVFVFHSAQFLNSHFNNSQEEELSWSIHLFIIFTINALSLQDMLNLWAEFSHNKQFAESVWPLYNPQTDVSLDLDINISTMAGYHSKECAFWDSYY